VRLVVELVRGQGGTELFTSHVPGEGSPAGFYARLGFVPTGELDPAGEIILRRIVHEWPARPVIVDGLVIRLPARAGDPRRTELRRGEAG